MNTIAHTLPCAGNSRIYDLALFEDEATPQRTQAVHEAAALCGDCPRPCEQKVTLDTAPQELALLPLNWMPAAREGVPEPEQPAPTRRRRETIPGIGRDYVRPDQRVTAWARMAAELADAGMNVAAIADSLCVTSETAAALLDLGTARRAA